MRVTEKTRMHCWFCHVWFGSNLLFNKWNSETNQQRTWIKKVSEIPTSLLVILGPWPLALTAALFCSISRPLWNGCSTSVKCTRGMIQLSANGSGEKRLSPSAERLKHDWSTILDQRPLSRRWSLPWRNTSGRGPRTLFLLHGNKTEGRRRTNNWSKSKANKSPVVEVNDCLKSNKLWNIAGVALSAQWVEHADKSLLAPRGNIAE